MNGRMETTSLLEDLVPLSLAASEMKRKLAVVTSYIRNENMGQSHGGNEKSEIVVFCS